MGEVWYGVMVPVRDNAPPRDSGNREGSGNTSSHFFHQHFLTLALFPLSYCVATFFSFLLIELQEKELFPRIALGLVLVGRAPVRALSQGWKSGAKM